MKFVVTFVLALALVPSLVLAQNCHPKLSATVPKLQGLEYAAARKALMDKGWQPVRKHPSEGAERPFEISMGNGPIFWARGFIELQSCSGTGAAYCLFEFKDKHGTKLNVVTAGEEDATSRAHVDSNRFVCDVQVDAAERRYTKQELISSILAASKGAKDERLFDDCYAQTFAEKVFPNASEKSVAEPELRRRIDQVRPVEIGNICLPRVAKSVGLDEFRVDHASYASQRVVVQAQGFYVMGNLFLKKSATDMSPVPVDLSSVNREQRLDVISNCADARKPCDLRVIGFAGQVAYQPGLLAKAVLLKGN
jgi:hypothetical protein